MKAFVQYLTPAVRWNDSIPAEKLVQACGSDGILPLDARLSLPRQIEAARAGLTRLAPIKRNFAGFEIHRGSLRNSRIVHTERA